MKKDWRACKVTGEGLEGLYGNRRRAGGPNGNRIRAGGSVGL